MYVQDTQKTPILEKSPRQMAMTKLNFFDKPVRDENSRTLLSQAKYTLKP